MKGRVKLYLLAGTAVVDFVYAATSPVIQIYFYSIIGSSVLAMANILTTALAAAVNASVQSDRLKDFYRHHFLWIIAIDVTCFALISFKGIDIPEVRFLVYFYIYLWKIYKLSEISSIFPASVL